MKQKLFRRTLIHNPFGIGDVLFSTPLVKTLVNSLPGVKINYICNDRTHHLLKNSPWISEVIVFEKDYFRSIAKISKIKFLKEFMQFLKNIKSFKADLMIDLSLSYQASLMGKILGISKRIGFNYRNRGRFLTDKIDIDGFNDKHVVLYYLDLLRLVDINISEYVSTEIFTSKKDDEWADNFIAENGLSGRFILGIVPGGGKSWGIDARYRQWPLPRFAHTVDKLIDYFDNVAILFGDINEVSLSDNMQSLMRNKIINMTGKTSVGQFLSLFKRCSVILCNEGGPLHVAVAMGIPSVSIFGPVDARIYGPYTDNSSKHIVISNRDKCKPCYSTFKHRKCDDLVCLNSISEDEVFNAVKSIMEKMMAYERK